MMRNAVPSESTDGKVIPVEPVLVTENEVQEKRVKNWGDQYDLWLIRKAQRKSIVEFVLDFEWAGVTKDKIIRAIPLRIDQNAIQIQAGEDEPVWVMKQSIKGFRETE